MLLLLLQLQTSSPAALAVRLAGMTAITGYEQAVADSLLPIVPGSARDRSGSVVLRRGSGAPARLVACPLDEPGYVVGGIRPDGWLTLHRVPGRVPPLADQQLEGQRVTVWGRHGPLPAVVGVRSVHLTRGRTTAEDPFTADNAYVDIGAVSGAQALAAGVELLSPVALAKRPHHYGDSLLAAPVAGRRASCAALVAAAREPIASGSGTTVIAFLTEQNLAARGLLTLMHEYGPFTETLIVDGTAGAPGAPYEGADSALSRAATGLGRVHRIGVTVRYAGTPVETIALRDVGTLADQLRRWLGGRQ